VLPNGRQELCTKYSDDFVRAMWDLRGVEMGVASTSGGFVMDRCGGKRRGKAGKPLRTYNMARGEWMTKLGSI